MTYYDWEKIVSNLSNQELVQIIKSKHSEIIEKVEAAEKELQKRGFQTDNPETLREISKPKKIVINENLPFLHTERAVWITSFFGGPLAAGYLIYENYRNLDNSRNAKISLIIGILASIVVFGGVFLIPEKIIDKIPNQIIPIIYTVIIYFIVKKIFGKELKDHKENGGRFYKTGRAVIVGAISLVLIIIIVFTYAFTATDPIAKKYDELMVEFGNNENNAITVFSIIESGDTTAILEELQNGTENWKQNILILDQMDKLNIAELQKQNQILREYCNLRLKSHELLEKKFLEKTNIYDVQIDSVFYNINNAIDRSEAN